MCSSPAYSKKKEKNHFNHVKDSTSLGVKTLKIPTLKIASPVATIPKIKNEWVQGN